MVSKRQYYQDFFKKLARICPMGITKIANTYQFFALPTRVQSR